MSRSLPPLRLQRLALELVALRDSSGLSQEEVARRARTTRYTIGRAEGATHSTGPDVLSRMLDVYEVPPAQKKALLALVSYSPPEVFAPYLRELPPRYRLYVDAEVEAQDIRCWEVLLIPGLLQTPEYAAAQVREAQRDASHRYIGLHVDLRLERQRHFFRRGAQLSVVISEAALRVQIGGPDVRRGQLLHLLELCSGSPDITVRVIPFKNGGHPAMTTSFTLLGLPGAMSKVVYLESTFGDFFLVDPTEIAAAVDIMDRLSTTALSPQASIALIGKTYADAAD